MTKDQLEALYASLAQRLGDLEYKKSQIEADIEQVHKELYGINYINAINKQIESNTKKAADDLQAKSSPNVIKHDSSGSQK